MTNFLIKFIFLLKRPRIILVTGNGSQTATEAVFRVLSPYFKAKKISKGMGLRDLRQIFKVDVLIIEVKAEKTENFKFFIKKSKLPILLVTHIGEWHPEREFFAGEIDQVKEVMELAEALPAFGHLILNFDDETVRDIRSKSPAHCKTFGFGARADFKATDIVLTSTPFFGTNFKLNYQGNIIPIWLKNLFGKEQIYAGIAAAAAGTVLDLNLVEISEGLKSYQSLPGKMRLIKGIKNSWILDDSASSTALSMVEALEILRKIDLPLEFGKEGRKIAVLGDILGIGKYTIESHEQIGEKVGLSADLLFTVGPRAKFFAQGAFRRGIPENKIFKFDRVEDAGKALQDEIKEGDLILVDGAAEMNMTKVIEEIKAFE